MTDGPDDILRGLIEGDSEGPAATAEQEAFVSGLLGSLRRDDPPMPDDVLRRLDAVLAEERRRGAPALVALPGGGSDDSDLGAGSAPASLPENVSVLPTASGRRGPTSRSFRILGGLAAAAVVVVGGSVVINNGSLGSSSDTSGGATAALAVVQDSNTAYSSKGFSDQAKARPQGALGRGRGRRWIAGIRPREHGGRAAHGRGHRHRLDRDPVVHQPGHRVGRARHARAGAAVHP